MSAREKKLSKQDFRIGAIYRACVRHGVDQACATRLLQGRASLTAKAANNLTTHWFSEQFRHGGIKFLRREFLGASR